MSIEVQTIDLEMVAWRSQREKENTPNRCRCKKLPLGAFKMHISKDSTRTLLWVTMQQCSNHPPQSSYAPSFTFQGETRANSASAFKLTLKAQVLPLKNHEAPRI